MRKLTIKRKKCFAGSLASMKVCIEDHISPDTEINGLPCRMLGKLKNGKEATFEIGEGAAKVFVYAGKMSRDWCNDYYEIPVGSEDIYLSGQNRFNPANGNAFIFDNNTNYGAMQNREKGKTKGVIILITAIIIGAIAGTVIGWVIAPAIRNSRKDGGAEEAKTQEKVFSSSGMSITLDDSFKKENIQGFTVALDSKEVAILMLREKFSEVPGSSDLTLKEYGEAVLKNNGKSTSLLKQSGDNYMFEYDYKNQDVTYHYVCYVYKTSNAFWLVQFASSVENAEKYAGKIPGWADSIKFD